jgi:hypothetical protein
MAGVLPEGIIPVRQRKASNTIMADLPFAAPAGGTSSTEVRTMQ